MIWIESISDALRLEGMLEMVIPWSYFYVPLMKRDLSDAAHDEALQSAMLALESTSKTSTSLLSEVACDNTSLTSEDLQ